MGGESERARWLSATPPWLAAKLSAIERDPSAVPRRLEGAELEALLDEGRAAVGDDELARSLLAWFGSGEGPWSGYPAYEGVAEQLLLRLGTEPLLAWASSHEPSAAEIAGLSRYLASYELFRSRRSDAQLASPELRALLIGATRASGNRDNLARLEQAFRPPARPSARPGGTGFVCLHPDRSVSEVAVSGDAIFAVEGFGLVRFDPGSAAPATLLRAERFFASLAVDDEHVYAALINDGTVVRLPHDGAEQQLIATGRNRPMYPALSGRRLFFSDHPFVPDPVRGAPYSVSRTIVCSVDIDGGPVRELASGDGGWDLALAARRACWVPRVGGKTRLSAVPFAGGPTETLIEEIEALDEGFVHLAGDGRFLYVATPTTSWMRKGVLLQRLSPTNLLFDRIDFVPGIYNGLHASPQGVALVVEQGDSLIAKLYRAGDFAETSTRVPRAPGPLVKPFVAESGAYFAVDNRVYRLAF